MKDSKKDSKIAREPSVGEFTYDEFFNNRLSLPSELKQKLTSEGLDWRFINALQFREGGNMHRSHWKPYKIDNPQSVGIMNTTAEGFLTRGDLVLATRPKVITRKHKEFLAKRNAAYSGVNYNKTVAQEMKKIARDYNVEEQVKVYEGYEEND